MCVVVMLGYVCVSKGAQGRKINQKVCAIQPQSHVDNMSLRKKNKRDKYQEVLDKIPYCSEK